MSTPQLSKNSCDRCRSDKIYCDKTIPSCSRCNYFDTKCSYLYVPKPRPTKYKKHTKDTSQLDKPNHLISKQNDRSELAKIGNPNRKLVGVKGAALYLSSGGYMLATNFFKNSVMNKNHKVFSSSNGKLDYFGVSPLALLLTMYVVHNTQPEHLNTYVRTLNSSPSKSNNNAKKLPIFFRFKLDHLNQASEVRKVIEISVEAFFNYFHPHLPVLNRTKFKSNFYSQTKLLQYIVVGIGLGYLPYIDPSVKRHYCRLAQLELKKSYSKMNLDTLSGLLIMSMFQHNQEDLKLGFQNLGVAITITNLLGLHLTPPRWVSKEEKELRIRLYWVVHFVDKLYGFSMTLPFGHDYRLCQVNQPKYSEFDCFENDTEEFKFSSLCSITYLSLISELCQLLYLVKLKFNFVDVIGHDQSKQLSYMVQVVDNHFKAWEIKVGMIYSKLHLNEKNKVQISNRFELYLKLVYNSALTQVYQTFNKVQLEPKLSQIFKLKAEMYSKNAIINALDSGNDFLTYGLTYKFYALSTATFYWVKVTNECKNIQKKEKMELLQVAVKLLRNCTPYYLLAEESFKMSKLLAKSENIALD